MLIVAGYLIVAAESRARYLEIASSATRMARVTPGCLAFAQSADPIEPDRVLIYERWESEADLLAFRTSDPDPAGPELPPLRGAEVARYEIAAVGEA